MKVGKKYYDGWAIREIMEGTRDALVLKQTHIDKISYPPDLFDELESLENHKVYLNKRRTTMIVGEGALKVSLVL